MPKKIVNSFNAGELSPYLYAREDVDKYQAGCQELENFVPLPYGGVVRRPSVEYVSQTKSDQEIRLYPFTFSVSESFMLEIGNSDNTASGGYFRFYKNGSPVNSGSSPFEVSHSYLRTEIKDLKFAQSGDVLFITHPSHVVSTLSRTSAADDISWQFSEYDFSTGFPPMKEQNTDESISVTTSAINGTTILTANRDLFNSNQVGAYFAFQALRTTAEQSITANYDSSQISQSVNASNSNWTLETNGTWLGRVIIQRSFDEGVTFSDYIVVGDTTGNGTAAGTSNSKNFITSSEEPEGNNVRLRVRYDHVSRASGQPFNFSLLIESPYVNSLVRITEYTSATEVKASVISPFQDKIGDYNAWAAGIDYNAGSKILSDAAFTATNFNYTSGNPVELTGTAHVALGTGLVANDLTNMNNVVGLGTGKVSQETYTISAASIDSSSNKVTITTSANHNIAVGMTVNISDLIFTDPPLSQALPDPTGDVVVTDRVSATQFKYAVTSSHSGSYNLGSSPTVTLTNVRYMYAVAQNADDDHTIYRFFSSPVDNKITCIAKAEYTGIEDVFDIAFANDKIYILAQNSSSEMRVISFSATTLGSASTVLNLTATNGAGAIASHQYYPRSIGFGSTANRFFIHYYSQERTANYSPHGSFQGYTETNNSKLVVYNSSFSSSISLTQYGTSQTVPFYTDITLVDNTIYALNSTTGAVDLLSYTAPHTASNAISIGGTVARPTGLSVHYDSDDNLQIYVVQSEDSGGSNGGSLYKFLATGEAVYYECISTVDSSTNSTLSAQLSAGNWAKRYPNMTLFTEGAFSANNGFPSCIALFQNRLCFSGVSGDVNTIWLSATDDYNNFTLGSLDTSAMSFTINSGNLDSIVWLVPHEALIIGTSGSEWSLQAESDDVPVSPTSFSLQRKTTYGSNNTQATLINSAVIFAMRQGRKVREWKYEYNSDDFVAQDLTIFSEHITEGGIENWAYQQQPDDVIWLIRSDGQLLGLTYERDQKVYAWHRHTCNTSGEFESVSVLPSSQSSDQVYLSTKVTINPSDWVASGTSYTQGNYVKYSGVTYVALQNHTSGSTTPNNDSTNWEADSSTKRFIGVLRDREFTGYTTNFVGSDFATVYSSPSSATLTGLDYLEGLTVSVCADGVPLADKTVSKGSINIGSTGHSKVVVGLNYTATLAPMYLDVETRSGTSMASKKDAQSATIRFKDTYQAKVGQTKTTTDAVKFNPDITATNLYSEDATVWMDNASEFLKLVYVINDTPTPCTVLAMVVNVEGEF